VTTGAADHHFEDRSHLLAALAEAGFVELSAKLAAGAETGGKVRGRAIRSMVLAYVNFARANPVRYGLMYLPEIEDRKRFATLHAAAWKGMEQLVASISRGVPDAPPPELLARAAGVWAACHGFASLLIVACSRTVPSSRRRAR